MVKKDYKLLKKLSNKPVPLENFSDEKQSYLEDLSIRGLVKLWVKIENGKFKFYVSLTNKGFEEITSHKKNSNFWTICGVIIALLTLLLSLLASFHDCFRQ